MDYLFLHRDKRTFTSERQKNLLFRAARLYWEQKHEGREPEKARKVDCELYKYVLYYLEVRQVFLDPKLSLKKLSDMIETIPDLLRAGPVSDVAGVSGTVAFAVRTVVMCADCVVAE